MVQRTFEKRMEYCLALSRPLVLGILAIPLPSFAASPECAQRTEPMQRLACYDAIYPPVVPTQQVLAQQAESRFGQRDGLHQGELDQLQARISELVPTANGLQLNLDNGQLWLVTERRGHVPVATGDRILIRKGALSGHILITVSGTGTRVRRLR